MRGGPAREQRGDDQCRPRGRRAESESLRPSHRPHRRSVHRSPSLDSTVPDHGLMDPESLSNWLSIATPPRPRTESTHVFPEPRNDWGTPTDSGGAVSGWLWRSVKRRHGLRFDGTERPGRRLTLRRQPPPIPESVCAPNDRFANFPIGGPATSDNSFRGFPSQRSFSI